MIIRLKGIVFTTTMETKMTGTFQSQKRAPFLLTQEMASVLRSFLWVVMVRLMLAVIDLVLSLTVLAAAFGLTSRTLGELRKEKDRSIFIIRILEQIQLLL